MYVMLVTNKTIKIFNCRVSPVLLSKYTKRVATTLCKFDSLLKLEAELGNLLFLMYLSNVLGL